MPSSSVDTEVTIGALLDLPRGRNTGPSPLLIRKIVARSMKVGAVTEPLRIDIWSDIACPWCYIGKRRLEAGIAAYADGGPGRPPVVVEYHSFQLSPDTPAGFQGSVVDFLVRQKHMSEAQVRSMLDRVTGIALEERLHYDFGSVRHTNTLKAHELLHYAKAHGVQVEVKERLLRAYFVEGRHVGRPEDLADLAAEGGLDREDALRALRRTTTPAR